MQEFQPSSALLEPKGKSRGKLILALATLSFGLIAGGVIVNCFMPYFAFNDAWFFVVVLTFLIAPILGISAAVMAIRDLGRIRTGTIPASGYGVTKLGQTLGIFGAVGDVLVLLVFLLQMFASDSIASVKYYMINNLNNLSANAYQYRIRADSVGGGGGSYTGYVIPSRLSRDETGIYTAILVHPDTIQFYAKWVGDSTSTITVRFGPDGRPMKPWIYGGAFQK